MKELYRQYLIDCLGYTFEELFGLSLQEHADLIVNKEEAKAYIA